MSLGFNTGGDLIVTGSFDHDSRLWDVRTGQCVHVLSGHRGEVSSTQFNYAGERGEEALGENLHQCGAGAGAAFGGGRAGDMSWKKGRRGRAEIREDSFLIGWRTAF